MTRRIQLGDDLKACIQKKKMSDKILDQYIRDYEMGNLEISPGGNFQDFLNRLIANRRGR